MGRLCNRFEHEVCEKVRKKIVTYEEAQHRRCRRRPLWDPRRWLCEVVTIIIKVVRWVVTLVCTLVTEVICLIEAAAQVATGVLDFTEWVWGVITQTVWWLACMAFGQSILKTVDVCVVVFKNASSAEPNRYTATDAEVRQDINNAEEIWKQCNVHITWSGHIMRVDDRPDLLIPDFDCPESISGVASALASSQFQAYRELATLLSGGTCRRIGWIGPFIKPSPKLFVLYIERFSSPSKRGCSVPLYPFVLVTPGGRTLAHEIGHSLNLAHGGGSGNLMHVGGSNTNLSDGQCCWARGGRFASVFGTDGVITGRRSRTVTPVLAVSVFLISILLVWTSRNSSSPSRK